MKTSILILILVGCLLLVGCTSAQNMTITNLDLVGKQNVLIYSSGGVLLGTYNTSSSLVPLPVTDFVMVLKPNAITRFSNPVFFIQDTFATLETYWLEIFMTGALIVLLMILAAKGKNV
jgi:hypothetical protein